jgi:hypothetical protein
LVSNSVKPSVSEMCIHLASCAPSGGSLEANETFTANKHRHLLHIWIDVFIMVSIIYHWSSKLPHKRATWSVNSVLADRTMKADFLNIGVQYPNVCFSRIKNAIIIWVNYYFCGKFSDNSGLTFIAFLPDMNRNQT